MEQTKQNRNAKKLKSVNATAAVAISHPSRKPSSSSSSFAYKNFNSACNKRRKNRKKYFEHDTRTRNTATTRTTKRRTFAAATKSTHSNIGGGGGATTAPIKKIKFNNEINIYETRNDFNAELDVSSKCNASAKKGQKKRGNGGGGFHHRRHTGNGGGGGSGGGGGVATTKRLQKQLIETQKKLQKQLNAMQQQQREQNNSFLALIHSNYIHATSGKSDSDTVNITGNAAASATATAAGVNHTAHIEHNPIAKSLSKSTTIIDDSNLNANKNLTCPNLTHTSVAATAHYSSEQFLCQSNFCTDQSKCSIDKMANGNKATAIRAFNCDLKKVKSKSFTPSPPPLLTSTSDIVCNHHCSTCIGYKKSTSVANINAVPLSPTAIKSTAITPTSANANDKKLLKIQLKRPLLKSIVLSANKSAGGAPAISSGIAFGKIKQEIDDTDHYSDEQSSSAPSQFVSSFSSSDRATTIITTTDFMHTADQPTKPHKYIDTMQFSNPKKTNKQINSYFNNKSNDFIRQQQQQKTRSYSPPLPATHRLASMVSSESHHTASANNNKFNKNNNNNNNNNNNGRRRSHSSRDRQNRSSEKRKKHRHRSHSRGSRSHSHSRSYSRSRSRSRSTSRSVSRSHSRSRSYRRHSSRSRTRTRSRTHSRSRSSRSYSRSHHSQDRKSRRSSKSSSKRDGGGGSEKGGGSGCGCNCNCNKCYKKGGGATKQRHSDSKNKSKSPSNDSIFSSSKQSNRSPSSDSKRMKRSTASTASDANGSTSKKKSTSSISGSGSVGQVKPQPIVKLHSSPMTGSDTENEIDDKFDRKYEELLTFETNEDERREQRLLKALSDIAAKAKQKIQSITDPNVVVVPNSNADRNHNDRSTPKNSTIASKNVPTKHNTNKSSEILHDDGDRHRMANRPISVDRYNNEYSPVAAAASIPPRASHHQHQQQSLPPPPPSSTRDRKQSKRDSTTKRSRRDSSCSSSSSKDEKFTRSSRSPSIPRRRGSPSFLDRRRITSARKKPIPYQRSSPYDSYDEWDSS